MSEFSIALINIASSGNFEGYVSFMYRGDITADHGSFVSSLRYRTAGFSTAWIVMIHRTNPQEIIAAITGRKSKHKGSAEIKEVS